MAALKKVVSDHCFDHITFHGPQKVCDLAHGYFVRHGNFPNFEHFRRHPNDIVRDRLKADARFVHDAQADSFSLAAAQLIA